MKVETLKSLCIVVLTYFVVALFGEMITCRNRMIVCEDRMIAREKELKEWLRGVPMIVTAYSPSKRQTQGDPFETASRERVSIEALHQIRYVAVSRNLLKRFTKGAPLEYGDSIFIEFIVLDTMNARYTNRVDIFFRNKELAYLFGIQERRVIIGSKDF